MIKVSVITSVYNTPIEFLQRYYQSMMRQTLKEIEVVLIDDGSVDVKTIDFLRRISANSLFTVDFFDENKGIGAARNYGISIAKGDYIAILDSDDYYKDEYLEELYRGVADMEPIDMVVADGYSVLEQHGNMEVICFNNIDKEYLACSIMTGARLLRRTWLLENEITFPNRKIYEDNCFFTVCYAYTNNIRYVNANGYVNCINQASVSHGRRYSELSDEEIPYEYIKKMLFESGILNNLTEEKKEIILGSVCRMLSMCVSLFSRKTDIFDRREIIRNVKEFSGLYIGGKVNSLKKWGKETRSGFRERILDYVYISWIKYGWDVLINFLNIIIRNK